MQYNFALQFPAEKCWQIFRIFYFHSVYKCGVNIHECPALTKEFYDRFMLFINSSITCL